MQYRQLKRKYKREVNVEDSEMVQHTANRCSKRKNSRNGVGMMFEETISKTISELKKYLHLQVR